MSDIKKTTNQTGTPKLARSDATCFQGLFDAINDAVIMFEVLPDGQRGPIKDVNRATCSRLGYTREELLRMTVKDIDAPETMQKHPSVTQRYGPTSTALFETVHVAKDGRRIPVEVNAHKFDLDGVPMVLAIIRDISARKKAEHARESYLQQLETDANKCDTALNRFNAKLKTLTNGMDQAERNFQVSESNLKALLDATKQSILFLKPDGTIIHVNKAVAENMRMAIEEITGRNIFQIFPPKLAKSRQKKIEKTIQSKLPTVFEDAHEGKTFVNTVYPIIEEGQVARLAVYAEDITEYKQTENVILESQERYRAFFQENESVMLIVDPETSNLVDLNRAAASFYGYTREQMLSMNAYHLNTLPKKELKLLLKKIKDGLVTQVTTQHKLANNERRDVEIFTSQVTIKGKTRLHTIIHDVTKRLQNEKELSKAKEQAERASQVKDEFIANISHEVRTPLNGVMGMLQLLQESEQDEEQASYIKTALQSSRSLLRVLNDVLDFSKIEANKMELIEAPFALEKLIEQCMSIFRIQIDKKHVTLKASIDPSARGWFLGDEGRIRQVLFNLLGNAIKFTNSGAITLKTYALAHPVPQAKRLFFSIEDSGMGIPDDKINYIFETFTQVDGSLARQRQGTGLGLPIVKRLVHLMGGNLTVESRVGLGTTITFFVVIEPAPPLKEKVLSPTVAPPLRPLNILLAEDDQVNRIMATRLLGKMGHRVTAAKNGKVCLNELKNNAFDVILMDIQMPGLTGLEATKIIRTDPDYNAQQNIPIIAITAHATQKDRQTMLDAGMNAYLSKPYEREILLRTLYETVG